MNVTYTGKQQNFNDLQTKQLNARFTRVSRMVDGRGEKELHVVFSSQRHLTTAEATLNYYGHSAIGVATEPEAFQALLHALDKLEKQIAKVRSKWRDTKRNNQDKATGLRLEPIVPDGAATRIRRVPVSTRSKPMTVDEAVLVIGRDGYLPFRDAETGSVSVLIRRTDGHFDLIEG